MSPPSVCPALWVQKTFCYPAKSLLFVLHTHCGHALSKLQSAEEFSFNCNLFAYFKSVLKLIFFNWLRLWLYFNIGRFWESRVTVKVIYYPCKVHVFVFFSDFTLCEQSLVLDFLHLAYSTKTKAKQINIAQQEPREETRQLTLSTRWPTLQRLCSQRVHPLW